MGIKSTTELTRQDAIDRIALEYERRIQLYAQEVLPMRSNAELENILERLLDESAEKRGSANFENFLINE